MTILEQYPFTVKRYDEHYANPIAVARISVGLDESTIHIFGDKTVRYELHGITSEYVYTPEMLDMAKREVRELLAACDWPAPAHDMMTGVQWQWLTIKHARGIL